MEALIKNQKETQEIKILQQNIRRSFIDILVQLTGTKKNHGAWRYINRNVSNYNENRIKKTKNRNNIQELWDHFKGMIYT